MSNDGEPVSFKLATKDGFLISVQRFEPPSNSNNRAAPLCAAVVIACGTGLDARFYEKFASWLATHGVGVCTFDYRYTGLSFPSPFEPQLFTPESRHQALLSAPRDIRLTKTWAHVDFAAVIRYASEHWPSLPLTILGHSLGGHMMTLITREAHRISRYLNVCGGNGHFRHARNPSNKYFDREVAHRLETDGVFRASRIGMGDDSPYGIGKEWVEWYYHPHLCANTKENLDAMRSVNRPYLFVGFADDVLMNKTTMENFLNIFSHKDGLKQSLWVDPAQATSPSWPKCGHADSFRKSTHSSSSSLSREESVWPLYLQWILHGTVASPGPFADLKQWEVSDERDVEAERAAFDALTLEEQRSEQLPSRFYAISGRQSKL